MTPLTLALVSPRRRTGSSGRTEQSATIVSIRVRDRPRVYAGRTPASAGGRTGFSRRPAQSRFDRSLRHGFATRPRECVSVDLTFGGTREHSGRWRHRRSSAGHERRRNSRGTGTRGTLLAELLTGRLGHWYCGAVSLLLVEGPGIQDALWCRDMSRFRAAPRAHLAARLE